jgi:hypothetical protein
MTMLDAERFIEDLGFANTLSDDLAQVNRVHRGSCMYKCRRRY